MARIAESWKLVWRRGIAYVRFRFEGKREDISTRCRDPKQASEVAARIYSDFISGRVKRAVSGALIHPATLLDELAAQWIEAITPELGLNTDSTYEVYARHWSAHFKTIGGVTSAAIGDYQRMRLGVVQKSTIVKERSALRRFLNWMVEREMLRDIPEFPTLPRKALGTKKAGRRGASTELSTSEVQALLAALPEWSERTQKGKHFPVRSRFVFAYETALRPATLDLLRWSDVTLAGLHIRAEVDKNRWDRVVPLSPKAREALKAIGPGQPDALIFGNHDYRTQFTAAGKAALGEDRGARVSPYDLKHARVTAWLDEGASVLGVRFLTGTKLALDRYAHASRRAAEQVIGWHSGGKATEEECEGEDLNLHGSYPASTSS